MHQSAQQGAGHTATVSRTHARGLFLAVRSVYVSAVLSGCVSTQVQH